MARRMSRMVKPKCRLENSAVVFKGNCRDRQLSYSGRTNRTFVSKTTDTKNLENDEVQGLKTLRMTTLRWLDTTQARCFNKFRADVVS